jgi:hypothetical protein
MANNLQKLRRILPALAIRTLFAVFSHITPLNAGEVPHDGRAMSETANEKAAVTITAASPKSTVNAG